MMYQTYLMEFSEVRAIIAQVVGQQPVPQDAQKTARGMVQAMCQEAAGYGLTTADVVRALLQPTFETRRGCDCPTCKERRSVAEEEQLQRWQAKPSQRLARRESVS